ncbi:tRNA adenosine(34) deaminase TadA [Oceanobacter mangrovi]|uniref:tRNA adenosine(34) deaminase TadA n=1 Tax=Oceanobacter mangrovi TaxID=2862510 RepID=UPI002484A76F|nr:tRNA adenosine(34) deaminase TadA [Oceanobacter mangrovi]
MLDQIINSDDEAMMLALQLAAEAGDAGEVPVGAVVVHNNRVVGMGANGPITRLDPTAHAEMLAIRQAASVLGNYRLSGCTLYVTLEPCTMCFGALIHSRIERLVYGATEPKAGVIESAMQLPLQPFFNHYLRVDSGVQAQACSQMLTDFFAHRRAAKKKLKQLARDAERSADAESQMIDDTKGAGDK